MWKLLKTWIPRLQKRTINEPNPARFIKLNQQEARSLVRYVADLEKKAFGTVVNDVRLRRWSRDNIEVGSILYHLDLYANDDYYYDFERSEK